MEKQHNALRAHRSFWRAPLLCSLLLLLGIGFALYSLYGLNAQSATAETTEVQQQLALNATLAKEKLLLESLQDKPPCEARQWLLDQGLIVPTPTAPATQAASTQPTPTAQDTVQPVATPSTAPINTASVIDTLEDATVFVLASTDAQMSMGSGFFITNNLVLTNRHVIESSPRNIIVINKKLKRVVRATLIAASEGKDRDYAVLQLDMPQDINISPLKLGVLPRRATKVSAWGYPHAISKDDPKYQALISGMAQAAPELVYTEGVVSAVLERRLPLIVHTAPLSPGSSGGPLADDQGRVVGINTLITLDEDSYRQTSIALPSTDILVFLQEKGIEVHR